jgi:hypothetical protein
LTKGKKKNLLTVLRNKKKKPFFCFCFILKREFKMNYLTLTCKEKPLFALKWENKKLDFF